MGAPSTLVLRRQQGPVALGAGGRWATTAELVPVRSERCTIAATRDGALRLSTVEHLFAALAGLGIREGVAIDVCGPEVPLLDGGASAFVTALASLGVPASPAALVVAAEGVIEVGPSRYAFMPADGTHVAVDVAFAEIGYAAGASWDGDAASFTEGIAPARTFGLEDEVAALVSRGLASHVSPESVVVLGRERVLSSGRPFAVDEPARHKLLDLIGDLYLHGGPPRGAVVVSRPGHGATHEAVARALASGLLVRTA